MPTINGEALPSLAATHARFHKLAGSFPEYEPEAPVLREGNGYLKGCRVEATAVLAHEDRDHVIQVLLDPASYGDPGMGARCFFPGFAFSFGDGANEVHVQVCLECFWVVFHSASGTQRCVPSAAGSARLRALYERLAFTS